MATTQHTFTVDALVPYPYVTDIPRTIAFYELLGFAVDGTLEHEGSVVWASLRSEAARLMLERAHHPVDRTAHGVLFYAYSPDVAALRDRLLEHGIEADEITHPPHMPAGQFRIEDPDGYVVFVGQLGPAG